MSKITLEVGKTYLSARGERITIARMNGCHFQADPARTRGTIDYREDGSLWMGYGSPNVLVSEAPPEQSQQSADVPNAPILDALLHGKSVQYKSEAEEGWSAPMRGPDAMRFVLSHPVDRTYRIKPEPVVQWCGIRLGNAGFPHVSTVGGSREAIAALGDIHKLLRIELDPDTLEVISAKTEAP